MSPLLAVHISDGFLTAPWCAGGFAVAGLLAMLGAWRISDEEIPRVALLTAGFFVAGLLHVPAGPTSVHLLLTGLLGVVLGLRSALAIPVALFLQAALLGHGGFASLGVNSCVMVLPALASWQLFAVLRRLPWVGHRWFRSSLVAVSVFTWVLGMIFGVVLVVASWGSDFKTTDFAGLAQMVLHPLPLTAALLAALLAAWAERRLEVTPEFPLGLVVGEFSVLLTVSLNCLVLILGGEADWHTLALILLVAHLPIALAEGVVVGFTVSLLVRVKPDVIGWGGIQQKPSSQENSARIQEVGKVVGCLLAVGAGLLIPASPVRAHALLVDWRVLPDHKIQVESRYSGRPRSFPAREADVRVLDASGNVLVEGKTNEGGLFVFTYEKEEPFTVEVKQVGHKTTVVVFGSDKPGGSAELPSEPGRTGASGSSADQEAPWLKDVLVGVGFLLAVAAFVLSIRNARALRAIRAPSKNVPFSGGS
jgi:cobalt/nickel transport system permease protein